MLIHFVHAGDAYLPELQAYAEFLQSAGHEARVHRQMETVPVNAAVLWWMCGRVSKAVAQRFPAAFQIHEYASASVPPLAWLKDYVKRWSQAVPQHRIYQNAWVRERMGFTDPVPWTFRDMGVSPDFFETPASFVEPEFDFVYLGEMQRLRHFLPVFDALAIAGRRLLLVGQVPDDLKRGLQTHANISFTGRVPHVEVPIQLRRARFGLNLVPNQLPYTRQTSTKLLEYCAAGLRVVSTDYAWVREFEQQNGARFAYLPFRANAAAYAGLLGSGLEQQALRVPDVHALAWPRLLAELLIWRQLGIQA